MKNRRGQDKHVEALLQTTTHSATARDIRRRLGLTVCLMTGLACAPATQQPDLGAQASTAERILIPAGVFAEGLAGNQLSGIEREFEINSAELMIKPYREVDQSAFLIDKFEVTNRQYRRFVEETGHRMPIHWFMTGSKSYAPGTGQYPVTRVTLHDAAAYCHWAGGRLPTEAEWEKAARGADGRLWVWGNEWRSSAVGNELSPVGAHESDISSYGVMNMAGNVSEWVAGTLDPPVQYTGLTKGGNYLLVRPYSFLGAGRTAQPQRNALDYLGFRCAADVPRSGPMIRLLPVENIDPEGIYENQFWVNLPPKTQRPRDTSRMLPWRLEIEVPALPQDRFAILFELYQNAKMEVSHASFNEDNTVYTLSSTKPGGLQLELNVHSEVDHVNLDYKIKNLGAQAVPTSTETCFQTLNAPSFRDHEGQRTFVDTTEGLKPMTQVRGQRDLRRLISAWTLREGGVPTAAGKILTGPLIAIVSKDGNWVVSTVSASGPPARFVNNCEYSCIHANPRSSLAPGETKYVRERIYFLRGSLSDLEARYRSDVAAQAN